MDYIKEITRIARENIDKADNAGYGMYNFPIRLNTPLSGTLYNEDILLQTYPYEDNEHYGLTYLLCYIELDDSKLNYDHEDFTFKSLTEEEKKNVFNAFRTQIGGETMETKEIRLIDFVRKTLTFEEKIKLINAWEEDRYADGEFVYDLDNEVDAKDWIDLYGIRVLYECRKEGRYWMGGHQFSCKGQNTNRNITEAWCVQGEKFNSFFTENNLFAEIKERYNGYARTHSKMSVEELCKMVGKIYYGYIDFEGYANALKPTKYKWVGVSSDLSFECNSSLNFDTKKDAYDDMRQFALEKMKWNTEYEDVNEGHSDDYIAYNVHFYTDKIIHKSYSGTYLFKIVPFETKIDRKTITGFAKEAEDYGNNNF